MEFWHSKYSKTSQQIPSPSSVRNLRRLTVSASFFGDMHRESQQETVEKTKSAAFAWMKRLLAHKMGAKFERLSLDIGVFHKRSPDMTVPLITHYSRCRFWRDTRPKRVIRLAYTYEDDDQGIWETKRRPRGSRD
ncbi:hypothetical protein N7G274_010581 [Stereocaulon virgatum]|uniref:Uncharacterized protein n=1 Tax=Stereocaulon virgatum TaxID=373712 RepID=A0ABR3ZW06_9LECA